MSKFFAGSDSETESESSEDDTLQRNATATR